MVPCSPHLPCGQNVHFRMIMIMLVVKMALMTMRRSCWLLLAMLRNNAPVKQKIGGIFKEDRTPHHMVALKKTRTLATFFNWG